MTQQDSFDLVPDFIRNWQQNEIVWKPGEKFVDADACFLYRTEGDNIPLAGKKEMVVITGREKTRKTALLQSILISAYIQDPHRTMGYYLDLEGPILHFDTEQSLRRCNYNRSKFHYLTGQSENDKYYRTFSLKQMSSHNMFEFITYTIEKISDEMGISPGLIAIDQVADLMPGRDVNSPEGADNIINHLIMWGEMTQALQVNVIHTNRGGRETNGQLGAMLDKKCDCSFLVSFDEDSEISTVTHKHSKDRRVPKFTFHHDEYGNPAFLKSLENNYKF